MAEDFKVTVHGQRAETFERVFGTTTVQVESPVPELVTIAGFRHPQRAYKLDLAALTGEQHDRLVAHLVREFKADEVQVRRHLEAVGLPILAVDATLMIEHPLKWVD